MTYLTPAGVMHTDILQELYIEIVHSCRSHAWRYLTPAGVIHIDILTPVGVIHRNT